MNTFRQLRHIEFFKNFKHDIILILPFSFLADCYKKNAPQVQRVIFLLGREAEGEEEEEQGSNNDDEDEPNDGEDYVVDGEEAHDEEEDDVESPPSKKRVCFILFYSNFKFHVDCLASFLFTFFVYLFDLYIGYFFHKFTENP